MLVARTELLDTGITTADGMETVGSIGLDTVVGDVAIETSDTGITTAAGTETVGYVSEPV